MSDHSTIVDLKARLSEHDAELAQVQQDIHQLYADDRTLRAFLEKHDQRIAELVNDAKGLLASVCGFASRLAALEIRVAQLERPVSDGGGQRPTDS